MHSKSSRANARVYDKTILLRGVEIQKLAVDPCFAQLISLGSVFYRNRGVAPGFIETKPVSSQQVEACRERKTCNAPCVELVLQTRLISFSFMFIFIMVHENSEKCCRPQCQHKHHRTISTKTWIN